MSEETLANNGAMDVIQIMDCLPHRPPFLLVDKLLSSQGVDGAHGVKYLSAGEFFFDGHFPGDPKMPKPLLLEVVAQVGATGVLSCPEHRGKYILFASLDNCHFGRDPRPGDVLEVKTKLISLRRGMGKVHARCTVDDDVLLDGTFSYALSDMAEN